MQNQIQNPCGEIVLNSYREPTFHITKIYSEESQWSTMYGLPYVIRWVNDNFAVNVDYMSHEYRPDILFITDAVATAVTLRFS